MIKQKIKILNYFGLMLLCFFILSCQYQSQEKDVCSKYADEKYLKNTTDASMVKGAFDYHQILLEKFGERSVKEMNQEAYHLLFYSAHGYGKSVKFERGGSLSVKCKSVKNFREECTEYEIRMWDEEWNTFEKMMYEFNFWTAEDFRTNKDVLDGYVIFLEGNRPNAKKCNKKSYKLVGRGSPDYDRMQALSESILHYEEHLRHKYEEQNIIKKKDS